MPVKNNQVVAIVLGAGAALLAVSLLVRFVLLSEYGVSGGWIFFGLPFGGIGVFVLLLRLGVLNFGGRSTGTGPSWSQNIGGQTPPAWSPQQAPTASQRLQELDSMRASGAISDSEYTARRQQILSAL
jgi:putative oligomerization/nucleic acid binding protein